MNHGISVWQPPHHVAQKFSSTTLPLKSVSFTCLPEASASEKRRAGLRVLSGCRLFCAGGAVERLCQRAIEQSTQRCARTRGGGAARKNKVSAAAANAVAIQGHGRFHAAFFASRSRRHESPFVTLGCHAEFGLRSARRASTQFGRFISLSLAISLDVLPSERLLGAAEQGAERRGIQVEGGGYFSVAKILAAQEEEFGLARWDGAQD